MMHLLKYQSSGLAGLFVGIFHCHFGYIAHYVPDVAIKTTNKTPTRYWYFNFCLIPKGSKKWSLHEVNDGFEIIYNAAGTESRLVQRSQVKLFSDFIAAMQHIQGEGSQAG